jgi:YVTN family beta-propeller protein
MLEFRILGSLEVLDDGRPIELGGARQRAVLAILLLHHGQTTSVDRIVDLMWGESAPATAVKTVQVYVSHLRRALVEDVIVTSPGGYALVVDAERVDARRFERLVDEGREALEDDAARAAELLRSALALWRGPALGDLAYERFAEDEGARLEELRLAAVEERVEADLRLGRHDELVPELEGLVREHPLRERLRAQHMLALYRSGRQADALESFRAARRSLVDQLGLEPGTELRELEQAILRQDPALELPRRRGPPRAPVRRRRALIAVGAAVAVVVVAAVAVAMNGSGADVAVLPDSVAVIDAESGRVVADVVVGAQPAAVATDGRSVWVANVADGTVSQIDVGDRRVAGAIVPNLAVEALAAGRGSVWIADSERGRAVRADADVGTVADSVRFPTTTEHPGRSTAAALGMGSLWVANPKLSRVFRIDAATRRVSSYVDVGNDAAAVAVGAGAVWVADSTDNTVIRIVPAGGGAVTDTIPLGNGPGAIAASDEAIWVANSGDDTVSRIDPATSAIKAEIPVGRRPSGIAVGAGAVWVANSLSGTVSRIDPRADRVTQTIEVGEAPQSLAVAGGRVWVSVQEAPATPVPAGGRPVARVLLEAYPDIRDLVAADPRLMHATCALLMTYDSPRGSRAAALVPELATAPPAVSAAGRVYTFRVRTGYRFSPPSGEPVTALAFRRAIERVLRNPAFAHGSNVDDIVGATAYRSGRARSVAGLSARGDRLTIRLTRPSPTLPERLATFYYCAVPPNTPIRPRGLERLATAGPYYVAAAAPRNRLVLRRNPGYPGPRPQRLEAIDITFGTPRARAVAEVEAGRADYAAYVPHKAQARLIARYGPGSRAAASGRQQYFAGPAPVINALLFNPRRPLFARAAMRRAVNYAIDRRALAQDPVPPLVAASRPTDQLIPPGWPGFRDATIYPLGGPDLATARRLAGGGSRRHGVFYTCSKPACVEHGEIVRANLAAIGIDLEIRQFSETGMYMRLFNVDEPFDVSLMGWVGEDPDPSNFMDGMFSVFPTTGFLDDTPLGRQLRAANRLSGAARIDAYAALDRDISAREAPFAPYLSGVRTDLFSARMGCQVEHPLHGIDLAELCVRD